MPQPPVPRSDRPVRRLPPLRLGKIIKLALLCLVVGLVLSWMGWPRAAGQAEGASPPVSSHIFMEASIAKSLAAAFNALTSFIASVEAQRGDTLTDAEADALIAAAQAIIDLLVT